MRISVSLIVGLCCLGFFCSGGYAQGLPAFNTEIRIWTDNNHLFTTSSQRIRSIAEKVLRRIENSIAVKE